MTALQRKTLYSQLVTLALWLVGLSPFVVAQQLPLKIYTTADGLASNRISRIVRDSRGYLWFCTENGLSRFDGSRFTNYTAEQGLPYDEVNDLLETRGGAYWIATGNGLCLFNPKGLPLPKEQASLRSNPMFVVYHPGGNRMASDIKSLYEDRSGAIWVGAWRGLYRLEQSGGKVKFHFIDLGMPASEPQTHVVRNILEDRQGALWLTTDSGLYRRLSDGTVDRFTRNHGFSSERLLGLIEDQQGRLWVGDRFGGLCLLVANPIANNPVVARKFATKDGLGCVRVGSLYEATDGRFWIGADCGLAELLPNADNARRRISVTLGSEGLTDPRVWSLAEDSQGNLWVGTANGAIKAEGLSSNRVRSIVEDNWGSLYIGTSHGLDRLDPATGRIRHFTTADGLANNQVIASYRDGQGALWFGTPTGLSRLIPEPDRIQPPPVALINRLHISGNPYPVSDLGETAVRDLELAPDQSNIRIDFAGLAFGAGAALRYQHKLEGADHDWSAFTEQRTIDFANLAPGRYRFLVRAVNADGVMSETPASFSFTILAPVWRRWWFLTIIAATLGLSVFGAYRYRVAQLVRMERIRLRIAQDLHDDIGSSLSQIAILSEVSRQSLGREQNGVGESLAQIASTSRDLVDSMSDIIWAINPRRDRVSDLTQRMRGFASDVFTAREIEFSFRAPAGGLELRLDADLRRQIYLIFKEAVNNATRHSRCTQAEIELDVAQDRLLLHVRDNGRGFDTNGEAATSRNGNGLASMRERARAIGGEIEIISQANQGTAVKLNLRLSPRATSRWRKYLPV